MLDVHCSCCNSHTDSYNLSCCSQWGYFLISGANWMLKFYQKLFDMKTLKGKWNDLIINANWTDNEEGFIKIWVNGKLKLDYIGKTISKIKTIDGQKHGALFRFGIYSQKWPGTIIAYFDNIKRSKVCEKLIRCQIRQNN